MMQKSLFGHLAFSFSKSPENLATEALCFILNRSQVANESFIHLISQTGAVLPSMLKFDTQADSNNSIPDLRGKDSSGKEIFIGEAKFWAGLTDNQPVVYLERLKKSSGSILLFIAPSKRFSTLWTELVRRCKEANLQPKQTGSAVNNFEIVSFDDNSILALTSWRTIINTLRAAVEATGDKESLSDIVQLQGLCEKMDEQAFLPLRSEELTSNIGKRIVQYGNLIDEIKNKLIEENIIKRNTTSGSTADIYVRYAYTKVGEYQFNIQFNANLWSKYRETPLWLGIKRPTKPTSSFSPEAKEKLSILEFEEPTRLFQEGDELLVPLFLPTGVEKSDVVQALLSQIQEISRFLV